MTDTEQIQTEETTNGKEGTTTTLPTVQSVVGPKGVTKHYAWTSGTQRTLCGNNMPKAGWSEPGADSDLCEKCNAKFSQLLAGQQPEGFEEVLAQADTTLGLTPDEPAEPSEAFIENLGGEQGVLPAPDDAEWTDPVEDEEDVPEELAGAVQTEGALFEMSEAPSLPTSGDEDSDASTPESATAGSLFSQGEDAEAYKARTSSKKAGGAGTTRLEDGVMCLMCGKPLKIQGHVTRGIGASCWTRLVRTIETKHNAEVKDSLVEGEGPIDPVTCTEETLKRWIDVANESQFDAPGEKPTKEELEQTHVPFKRVYDEVKAQGRSIAAFGKAFGHDRGIEEPLNENWRPYYAYGSRWFRKEALDEVAALPLKRERKAPSEAEQPAEGEAVAASA
jgi:hypothetical protein